MFWNKLFGKKARDKGAENGPLKTDAGKVKAIVATDVGNIRTNNEDVGLFFRIADETISLTKGDMLLVADGMGGHHAGEVASKMAAEIVVDEYYNHAPSGSIESNLAWAFTRANERIFEHASSNGAYSGMGTTCTALVVVGSAIYYAHVGDSRAYILKKDALAKITRDHTFVQELVDRGKLTPEQAHTHPRRNILTNAMGTKPDVVVDTGKCRFVFEENDRLLLCSDGLYDYLADTELADRLRHTPLSEAAGQMIEEAKKRGGHDNITVVLAEKTPPLEETPSKDTGDLELPQNTEPHLL